MRMKKGIWRYDGELSSNAFINTCPWNRCLGSHRLPYSRSLMSITPSSRCFQALKNHFLVRTRVRFRVGTWTVILLIFHQIKFWQLSLVTIDSCHFWLLCSIWRSCLSHPLRGSSKLWKTIFFMRTCIQFRVREWIVIFLFSIAAAWQLSIVTIDSCHLLLLTAVTCHYWKNPSCEKSLFDA